MTHSQTLNHRDTLTEIIAQHHNDDPTHALNLNQVLPSTAQHPAFASVFIHRDEHVDIEEYDGKLEEAFEHYGSDNTIALILRSLCSALEDMVATNESHGYFTGDDTNLLDYCEIIFHSYYSDSHYSTPVYVIFFENNTFNAISPEIPA